MASITNVRGLCAQPLRSLSSTLSIYSKLPSIPFVASIFASNPAAARSFHSTPAAQKRQTKPIPTDSSLKARAFRKLVYGLPPAPLRMARNRALRHWTIHRAWLLLRRQQREAKDRELYRMYQGMSNACEALRTTEGPGTREEGYLYRVAMEKKGVYGEGNIPIEYARHQTDTPAREAWNHDWKP
jgi:large subunit ribosomal protein L40